FLTIVSPFPKNQGNRINIFSIIKFLVKNNFIVDLVMLGECLKEDIEKYFDYKVNVYTTNINYSNIQLECRKRESIKNAFFSFLSNNEEYRPWIKEMFNVSNSFHPFELIISDDMINKTEQLLKKYNYYSIFCSYLFTMKITQELKHLISSPIILITHDAHSKLNELAFEYGINTSYRACTPEIEAEILNMADKVLAITSKERDYFQSIGVYKKIIVSEFSCYEDYRNYKVKTSNFNKKSIFYCASNNPSNKMGLDNFLYRVWPSLIHLVPGIRMIICGNICDTLHVNYKNIELRGEINHDQMLEIMSMSTIGINPVYFGTGLKIKSVEFMSIGLPFVSFEEGASGLEEFDRRAFLISKNWIDFGKKIVSLLNSKDKWLAMSKNARKIAQNRFIDSVVFKDVL
ncbi:glycosyltransferase family 4 protein, partial [Campylobacter jejuni]|nr:glycosyltransferase family 4 protein [Campylobacter jejuni]